MNNKKNSLLSHQWFVVLAASGSLNSCLISFWKCLPQFGIVYLQLNQCVQLSRGNVHHPQFQCINYKPDMYFLGRLRTLQHMSL